MMLALTIVFGMCSCGQRDAAGNDGVLTWQEQYDLGVRYLTEGNYEEAILAFTAAIEIDPRQADAYIGLAEVYTQQGNTEKAAEILNKAVAEIGGTDALTAALETLSSASGSIQQPTPESSGPPDQDLSRSERNDYPDGTYLIDEYDANGNHVRQTMYKADGVVDYYHAWEYGANGSLMRHTEHSDSDERLTEYNAAGHPVCETRYMPDGTIYGYTAWEYDADGRLVRETDKNSGWHRVDEFDIDGNRVRRTYYKTDGSTESVFEYNADGNVTARYDY